MKHVRSWNLSLSICLIVLTAVVAVVQAQQPAAHPANAPSQAATPASNDADAFSAEAMAETVKSSWLGQVFGWGMAPLWLCSVILLALIFERFGALRYGRVFDNAMVDAVERSLAAADLDAALAAAEKSPSVLGKAWTRALQEYRLGGAALADTLDSYTALAFKPLRRNLNAIATLGVISPSFGLLGTIIGMIIVFGQIELTGGADKSQLAGGIALALFTTAGGLIVSIPAVIAGRYFRSRLGGFADQAESLNNHVSFRYAHAVAAAKPDQNGKGGREDE